MPSGFGAALRVTWITVLAYWLWSARRLKAVERMESLLKRFFAYWLPIIVAGLLLGPGEWFGHTLLRRNFVPHTSLVYSIGITLCVSGAILAIWSRHLLGRNWSLAVQIKEDHQLVRSGPYQYVRHPIYTALLLLFTGNAIMVGDWRGVLAVVIVFVSLWWKLKIEERWLTQRFGQAYSEYRMHTKALVPLVL